MPATYEHVRVRVPKDISENLEGLALRCGLEFDGRGKLGGNSGLVAVIAMHPTLPAIIEATLKAEHNNNEQEA